MSAVSIQVADEADCERIVNLITLAFTADPTAIGTELMKYSLMQFEQPGVPVYLESSNPENIPFYERLGFAALGQINAGDKAILTPMLRT